MSENLISKIKLDGVTYTINDTTKASIEQLDSLIDLTSSGNEQLVDANDKLDQLLAKIGSSGPGEESSSAFAMSFAKVTSYKPAVEAYTSVSAVTVTGFGIAGEYEDEDYSIYNGTYVNTPATESSSTPIEWIFKHETKNAYIFYYADEYGDFEGWFIDTQYNSGSYESLANRGGTTFPSGQMSWSGYYNNFTLSLTPQLANHEAEEQVLKVVKVSIENDEWKVDDKEIENVNYVNTPVKHGIYLINNDTLLGDPIAYHDNNVEYINPSGLIVHFPMDEDGGEVAVDIINGLKLIRSGNGVYATGEGWKCVKNNENLMGIIDTFEFPEKFTISIDMFVKPNTEKEIEFAPILSFGEHTYSDYFSYDNVFGMTLSLFKLDSNEQEERADFGYRGGNWNSQYHAHPGITFEKQISKDGEWINYTLTCDRNKLWLYLNGKNIDSADYLRYDDNTDYIPEKFSPLLLLFSDMKKHVNSVYRTFIDGIISKVTIWDRALNVEEIMWLYNKTPQLRSIIPSGFTSNTSMNGYVIDQDSFSYTSSPNAWQVFNGNESSRDYGYVSANKDISPENPAWFSISLPSAIIPYKICYCNEIQSPENFKTAIFQARNSDAEEWEDLLEITNPNEIAYRALLLINNEENKAYSQFRMLFTSAYNSMVTLQSFEIYSNETVYNSKWNNLIHK